VGVNAHGVAQGVDSLTASDDGVGVPRVLVSRHALDARDRGDAMARAGMPGRAGGYAHVYATPSGEAFAVETTGRREALLDGPGAHTNHYLAPALADVADEASERSLGRHRRLGELLVDHDPTTPEQVMALLADHGGTPEAVCRHPQAADGPDASVVLFSMVCDVQAGRMWVAPGNPCTTPFQEVDLGDVLASDTVR
jgi:isopenicillin-N N-acyltransferase-like protein